MLVSVTKAFEFEAAHHLEGYDGKCSNLHGHSYKLEVTVTGSLQTEGPKKGMVIDFGVLKAIVNKKVISKLDHKDLNDIIPVPTAECTVLWIWKALYTSIAGDHTSIAGDHCWLSHLKLWETSSSYVEVGD